MAVDTNRQMVNELTQQYILTIHCATYGSEQKLLLPNHTNQETRKS